MARARETGTFPAPVSAMSYSLTMPQVAPRREIFDAIVVGSGATGGWAAKKLTEAGMRVAMLEAGARLTPPEFTEHKQPWNMPYLGMSPKVIQYRPVQGRIYACP